MRNKKEIDKKNKIYTTHNNMSDLSNGFKKIGLEFLKSKYKKTTDDFIRDTYPKKDQANMRVKISRLINKKNDAPSYFGALELAEDLSNYFNKFRVNGDLFIAPTFFLGGAAYVDIIGASYGNGQIGLFKKSEVRSVAVPVRYTGYQAIESKAALSTGMIRLFKPRNFVYPGADNRFGLAMDKKTKIIWVGSIEPRSNGNHDILDKSASTGKIVGTLAEDITLAWSSRVEQASFPTYMDF